MQPEVSPSGSAAGSSPASMPALAKIASKALGELAVRSRIRNRKEPVRSPRSMSRLRICWAVHGRPGVAVTPRMCTSPGADLHDEQAVQALEEDSCPHGRNHRRAPVGPARAGMPARRCPRPPGPGCAAGRAGSVGRRCADAVAEPAAARRGPCGIPRPGSPAPAAATRSRMSGLMRGRPVRFGYVHLRVISRRCQASSVPGVTSRWARSTAGSCRASAARMARSAQSGLGRAT